MPDPGITESAAEPIHRHGSVFLRPAERDDLPTFVRWLSDDRTTRTLALRSPLSLAMEEGWFGRLLEHHGNDVWHFVICRADDGRPVAPSTFTTSTTSTVRPASGS